MLNFVTSYMKQNKSRKQTLESAQYGLDIREKPWRSGGAGRGVLPYMGYIGMCGPKGYGFSAVLLINRIWFLHSNLDMGIYLRSHLFVIIEKKIDKSPSQIMFTVI